MNTTPMSGYPENPEKQSRLKQITILIERHNFLVDQVSILERDFDEKYDKLNKFKQVIREDIQQQKHIIKRPQMNKLQQRIDDLNYGNFIYREEFLKKIK